MKPRALPVAVLVLVLVMVLVSSVACGGAPPQIVDYSPQRGSKDVSTAVPITITFDHDVDQPSVASRLHLVPATEGTVRWLSPRQLAFDHPTLLPSTTYQVVLEAGYRDPAGNVYTLRHSWSFVTEAPPSFAASSPSDGQTDIDPADYISIDFTREMNGDSLRGAITFSPSIRFSVRLDPGDARHAIVAPDSLLDPSTAYTLLVTTSAQDVDGNQLDLVRTVHFSTGPIRPLHHWIAFVTQDQSGASGGLWIVNETGFPRQLLDVTSLDTYSWSPDGERLVYKDDAGEWTSFTPGASAEQLGFTGSWAAALASGLGYVYIDDARSLRRQTPDGASYVIAPSVAAATVSPDGRRVAFAAAQASGTQIWGYDVALRASYVLGSESGEVTSISWAPAGNRIAYLAQTESGLQLRVRSLAGAGTTDTVARGDITSPVWLRDSDHLLFAATVASDAGPITKAFLINAASPPASLTAGIGIPADPTIEVTDPVPSPDGHQIAFITGGQVWIMNADGTRPTPLTSYDPETFPYSCRAPAWTRS